MKKIIYPDYLEKNDYIGITATSQGITKIKDLKRLEKVKNKITELNYRYIITNNVFTNKNFVSSLPKTRALELHSLWQNNKVKVISQVRGGEFLMEMLPFLDDNIIKNNKPKWITGYSDSSLLNFYITTKFNIATLTSPNILHFSMNNLHESLINKLSILEGKEVIQKSFFKYEYEKLLNRSHYNLTKLVKYKSLYKNEKIVIEGRIIGGCIEAITEIIGTKYDYVEKFINNFNEGMLWYIDIYDSNPLNLNRLLWQMKEANWFNNINGVIIGRTRSIKKINDLTYQDVLHKIFDEYNIPIIYDVDLGHVMPSFSIINGSYGIFTYNKGKGILEQNKI